MQVTSLPPPFEVWDVQNGKCIMTLTGHTNSVECLSPLGSFLASAGGDTRIKDDCPLQNTF